MCYVLGSAFRIVTFRLSPGRSKTEWKKETSIPSIHTQIDILGVDLLNHPLTDDGRIECRLTFCPVFFRIEGKRESGNNPESIGRVAISHDIALTLFGEAAVGKDSGHQILRQGLFQLDVERRKLRCVSVLSSENASLYASLGPQLCER